MTTMIPARSPMARAGRPALTILLLALTLTLPAAAQDAVEEGMVRGEGGEPVPRELLDYRQGQVLRHDRERRTLVVGRHVYTVPLDLRVLDPNGSVRSREYLSRGMTIRYRTEPSESGRPLLVDVRVVDVVENLPEH